MHLQVPVPRVRGVPRVSGEDPHVEVGLVPGVRQAEQPHRGRRRLQDQDPDQEGEEAAARHARHHLHLPRVVGPRPHPLPGRTQ